MQLKHKVVIQAPHGAFFVGFGEGWIGSLFSRSDEVAESMRLFPVSTNGTDLML
jgi:hypothetical protein